MRTLQRVLWFPFREASAFVAWLIYHVMSLCARRHSRRFLLSWHGLCALYPRWFGAFRVALKENFSAIYENNAWGSSESVSGGGSTSGHTQVIREALPVLLKDLGVRTLLDIPCGDFNWMKEVPLEIARYIGADIVPELVALNTKRFGKQKPAIVDFLELDITTDRLPTMDLILCRDCLVHLCFDDIWRAINNIRQSNSQYLLTTTFRDLDRNIDIVSGAWRPLNLQLPPFAFPAPVRIVNEYRTAAESRGYPDKSLGLWRIADMPVSPGAKRQGVPEARNWQGRDRKA